MWTPLAGSRCTLLDMRIKGVVDTIDVAQAAGAIFGKAGAAAAIGHHGDLARHLVDPMMAAYRPFLEDEARRDRMMAELAGPTFRTANFFASIAPPFESMVSLNDALAAYTGSLEEAGRALSSFSENQKAMMGLIPGGTHWSSIGPSIERLGLNEIGAAIGLHQDVADRLGQGLSVLLDSAARFYRSEAPRLGALPRGIVQAPSRQVALHVRALEAISYAESEEPEESVGNADEKDRLAVALEALSPHLVRRWRGGHEAVAFRGSDSAAHAALSFREVLKLTLYHLAPDRDVSAWCASVERLLVGNRVSRADRFDFICRDLATPLLAGVLENDRATALQLITVFNKDVHEERRALTDFQLRRMAHRVDQALLFLLDTAQDRDR